MAEGGDFGYDDPDLDNSIDHDDNDESSPLLQNKTGSFTTSTPAYQTGLREEMEMTTFQEKGGRPEPSYAETPFGGTRDLEKRLAALRRDAITGMLNTTKIPNVENPLNFEEKEKEIQNVRDFIIKRYPNADLSKLVIRFSSKKPMDIVVLGKRGGETKIIKDNGSDFQRSFLNLTYVKSALGESAKEIIDREQKRIDLESKMLADLVKKSPENKAAIDALKDKISKKVAEKKIKRKRVLQNKTNRRS